MKKLKTTKKITLATLKSFAKRNKELLFYRELSSFNSMEDCVSAIRNNGFKKTTISTGTGYCRTGIQGIYTVGSSGDYFTLFEDEEYIGINVFNCCGESILAIKKPLGLDRPRRTV